MIVGFVVWGQKPEYYLEAAFSILSFLGDPAVEKVCVVVENPQYLGMYRDRIVVEEASAALFEQWGKGYRFRRKIEGVRRMIELYPGRDLLFVDSDTFLGASLDGIEADLAIGKPYMHEVNGTMDRATDNSNRRMWPLVSGKTIAGVTIPRDLVRRNSGVIALPGRLARDLADKALALCDGIYAVNGGHSRTEELAFSAALGTAGDVGDAAAVIGHYCGNKHPWRRLMADFFAESKMLGRSLDDDIEALKQLDLKALPTHQHFPKRRKMLEKYLDRFLPPRQVRHFQEMVKPW